MKQIDVYVGEDGGLHFRDCEGADTELPFKRGITLIGSYPLTTKSGLRNHVFTVSVQNIQGYKCMTEDDFAVVTKTAFVGYVSGSIQITWGEFGGVIKSYDNESGILTVTANFDTANHQAGETRYSADVYC